MTDNRWPPLDYAAWQETYATLIKLAPAFADLQSALNGAKSAADVLSELDTIDTASIVAALDNRPVDLGVAPPFTLGVADNQLGLPRVFRVTFQTQEIRDGEIVPSGDGTFLDVNDFVTG